jgi:protein-S-isoprenylcysteine O-methyltransferase Ste14
MMMMKEINSLIGNMAVIFGVITLVAPVIFIIHNSRQKKGGVSGKGAILGTWPFVLLILLCLSGIAFLLWRPVPIFLPDQTTLIISIIGGVFYFPGIFLYVWSLFVLGSQFGVSTVFGAGVYEKHQLIRKGPYALIRHPMYLGVLLAAIGALLVFKTWAMILFTPLSWIVIGRADREEDILEKEFGEEWKRYAAEVPKWWPGIF